MIAPAQPGAPTRPGRCDQQSLADGRPRGLQQAGRTRALAPTRDSAAAYAAAQLRALGARRAHLCARENTQAVHAPDGTPALHDLPARPRRADPRKLAVRLPEIGSFEAL